MAWEMLSIALGISTFKELLRGRKVIVWGDNTGAEAACRKGSAKSWDHAQALELKVRMRALLSHFCVRSPTISG